MPLPQIWSLNPIYKQQLHYLYNMTHFCFFIRKETSKMIGSQWSLTGEWGRVGILLFCFTSLCYLYKQLYILLFFFKILKKIVVILNCFCLNGESCHTCSRVGQADAWAPWASGEATGMGRLPICGCPSSWWKPPGPLDAQQGECLY